MADPNNKYLFELIWTGEINYFFDEFNLRTLLTDFKNKLQEKPYITKYLPIQDKNKIRINFEFYEISAQIIVYENTFTIRSISTNRDILVEKNNQPPTFPIINLPNDPNELILYVSSNCMVNQYIFNMLAIMFTSLFENPITISLLNSKIIQIKGEKYK